jgi:transposase
MKILSRNENFTGERCGITFFNGKAQPDTEQMTPVKYDWFVGHGYTVEGKRPEAPKPEAQAKGKE